MTTTDRTAGGQATPVGQRPAVAHRFVIIALIIAALIATPGVLGRLGLDLDSANGHGAALIAVTSNLNDIRFGSGLRFWLGVGGATAMALLLLYPLRKIFAGRRLFGRIASWFKLHLLVGIFAPVAILYHANFGLGGTNANVALWTMLVVAASGIVGHFVYARASTRFYSDKQTARRQLDQALDSMRLLGGTSPARERVTAQLEQFDAAQLAAHRGIRASAQARYVVAKVRRAAIQDAISAIDQLARSTRLDPHIHAETRTHVAAHLHAYFNVAVRAANRSVTEQIWARWRLFHLPLFLIMCAATALHVVAVWDIDATAPVVPQPPAPAAPTATPTTERTASTTQIPIQQLRRATIPIAPGASTATPPSPTANARKPSPTQTVTTPPPTPGPVAAPASPVQQRSPADVVAPSARADAAGRDELFEALRQRTEGASDGRRMGLGQTRTLADQIATFKARIRTREFKHSDAETGFALTGRHTRADCTDCHTQPLAEARSENPRACIACHKKDDVHKGRRPACADCHTTNSFRERKKRQ